MSYCFMREIICIRHITHDHIVTPDIDLHIPGGTAWYFAWGMHALAASDSEPLSNCSSSKVPPTATFTTVARVITFRGISWRSFSLKT